MRELQEKIRVRYNNYRTILRLIQSFDFEYLYNSLTDIQKNQLELLLLEGNKEKAIDLLRSFEEREIENLTMERLRKLAGKMAISYYTTLTREQLIAIILQARKK